MSAVSTVISDAYKKIQPRHCPKGLVWVRKDKQVLRDVAGQWVAKMICKDTSESAPCGKCNACRLWEEKSHPDILCIEPDGQSIKIDSVNISVFQWIIAANNSNSILIEVLNPIWEFAGLNTKNLEVTCSDLSEELSKTTVKLLPVIGFG